MSKKPVEQTGLIPRSIIRTFDRFRKQLFPKTEKLIIQEFRISRYQFLVSIKCLANLIFLPLIVNYLLKNFLLIPVTENLWNTQQPEIFLNLDQQNRAFHELKKFQEKMYFEYLITDIETQKNLPHTLFTEKNSVDSLHKNLNSLSNLQQLVDLDSFVMLNHDLPIPRFFQILVASNHELPVALPSRIKNETVYPAKLEIGYQTVGTLFKTSLQTTASPNPCLAGVMPIKRLKQVIDCSTTENLNNEIIQLISSEKTQHIQKNNLPLLNKNSIQQQLQEKTLELAIYYNSQSILALTNLIGDFITFILIGFLLIYMKPEISILKSFLTESIYSLNDTKKSFLLILGTDLLVGFHSPRGWEICLQLVLRHFGFPENKDFVFLFVASFPVLLDTVFKYWIFRYLNKISPSTVATYHSMIE